MNSYSETGTSSVDYFDDLISEGEQASQAAEIAEIKSGMLTQEQFRQSFIGIHGMASAMTGIKALALPNTRIEEAAAEEVADTIYETILDIPMLHFIIQPGNKWLGRGLVMLVYVQGMRGAIIDEIGSKPKKSQKFEDLKAKTKDEPPQEPKTHGAMSPEDANNLFNGGKIG